MARISGEAEEKTTILAGRCAGCWVTGRLPALFVWTGHDGIVQETQLTTHSSHARQLNCQLHPSSYPRSTSLLLLLLLLLERTTVYWVEPKEVVGTSHFVLGRPLPASSISKLPYFLSLAPSTHTLSCTSTLVPIHTPTLVADRVFLRLPTTTSADHLQAPAAKRIIAGPASSTGPAPAHRPDQRPAQLRTARATDCPASATEITAKKEKKREKVQYVVFSSARGRRRLDCRYFPSLGVRKAISRPPGGAARAPQCIAG